MSAPLPSLHAGDCLDVLARLKAEGRLFDACVTDPPYHLTSIVKRFGGKRAAPAKFGTDGAYARAARGFMGKTWDGGDIAFRPETWRAVFDVLKPGAHLVAFGGTRTFHRMVCAIEDAGFEVRDFKRYDCAFWTKYGALLESLSPEQSAALLDMLHDLSGEGVLGWVYGSGFPKSKDVARAMDKAAGAPNRGRAIPTASTRLPGGKYADEDLTSNPVGAYEPVTPEGAAWNGWGTALKPAWEPIILARKPLVGTVAANIKAHGTGGLNIDGCRIPTDDTISNHSRFADSATSKGIYGDSSAQPTHQTDGQKLGRWPANVVHDGSDEVVSRFPRDDAGSSSRFFFAAKASAEDRAGSRHPTVKPVDLIRWLVRLVTPPGGTVLDPFAGSGTTGAAAWREDRAATLIEREAEYCADIERRIQGLRDGAPLLALLGEIPA